MARSNDNYLIEAENKATRKPLFVLVLTAFVLAAFLISLYFVYPQENKAILFVAVVFMATFGMFIVRDVKPYLFFSLAMATSINVDFFFFQDYTTNYYATRGYYLHIIFFPVIIIWFIQLSGVFGGSKRFTLKHTGITYLLVFVLMTVLSIQQSAIPAFSYYELYSLGFCLLLYFLLSNSLERRKEIFALFLGIAVVITFQGMLSLAQYIKGSPLGLTILGEVEKLTVDTSLSENVRRVSGTLGYPNTLAQYLDFLVPTVVGMALMTRHFFYRSLFVLAALLGTGASVLTVSRGGIAAVAIGSTLVIIYWGYRKRLLVPVAIIGLLVFSIAFSVVVLTDNPIKSRLFQENDASARSRPPMLMVAERVIESNLFFGVGINNYTSVAPRYDTTSIRISYIFPYPVHNILLLLLAEIGIIGFISFMLFVLTRLVKGISLGFDKNKDYGILGFSLSVGLIMFLLHGMVDYSYITSNFTFWFVCGLITGLYRLRKGHTTV